jgi:hypothetical protein
MVVKPEINLRFPVRRRAIHFYEFATQKTREVFRADKDLSDGMSISPDGRYMLYSQIDEVGADIMLVNNFR